MEKGCATSDSGGCTVIIDEKSVNSCLMLAIEAERKEILTIKGMARNGDLHTIQKAFIDEGATHCGYCTTGMVLSAKSLLDENLSQ